MFRRTLMIRDKIIHKLKMHLVSRHSAILEVWASAGTYIKEFVHGDLGRTTPNVGSLLNK
jgi:tRNA pseudouridine synthase 10